MGTDWQRAGEWHRRGTAGPIEPRSADRALRQRMYVQRAAVQDPVIRRMKQQNQKTEIKTLAALNAYLKSFGLSGLSGADFDDEMPATAELDQVIAKSALVVTAKNRGAVVGEVKSLLASGKGKKAVVDPLVARKAAAKSCPSFKADKGSYYGGAANELHVHDVGGDLHVKVGADDRKNIYVNSKLRKDVLKEVRKIVSAHPLAATLHAAIDKGLLKYNLELDTY